MPKTGKRLWELDALRGIAIILMIIFHIIFNLETFFGIQCTSIHEGFWFYEGRVAAIMFIVLVGVTSSLIHQHKNQALALQKNSYRGLRLISLGFIITAVTFILARDNTIWFGILHFLGLSILISIPLCKYRWLNLGLAAILFAAYYPISRIYTESHTGLIFGIMPPDFTSYDHYALIPWLGFVLIGIALGNRLYHNNARPVKRLPTRLEKALATTGKYSLWIYFIHQPIILSLLWIFLH